MSAHHGFLSELGFTRAEAGEGRAVMAIDIQDKHLSPTKTVHGGVIYSLADTAMGSAIWSTLEPGETCATISANVDYVAAVRDGRITCEAEVVRRGTRTAFTRALVYDGDGNLVAQVTAAFHVGRGSGKRLGKGETSTDRARQKHGTPPLAPG